MYLLAIGVSSSEKCLLGIFVHFLRKLLVFFLSNSLSTSNIVDINLLSDVWLKKSFSLRGRKNIRACGWWGMIENTVSGHGMLFVVMSSQWMWWPTQHQASHNSSIAGRGTHLAPTEELLTAGSCWERGTHYSCVHGHWYVNGPISMWAALKGLNKV